jgi:hypothetical protein
LIPENMTVNLGLLQILVNRNGLLRACSFLHGSAIFIRSCCSWVKLSF